MTWLREWASLHLFRPKSEPPRRHSVVNPLPALLASVFFFPHAALAEQNPPPHLLFVGPDGASPYISADGSKAAGILADITAEISILLDRSVQIRLFDFREARRMVRTGDADAVLLLSAAPERQQHFDFSAALFDISFTIFARENENHPPGWPNRNGVRIGVYANGMSQILAKRWYPKAKRIVVSGTAGALRQVQQSRIDALITTRRTGNRAAYNENISNVVALPITLLTATSAIAVKKGNTDLLTTLNRAIKHLHREGKIARILSEWEGTRVLLVPKHEISSFVALTVAGVSIAFLFIGLFFVHQKKTAAKRLMENEENLHTTLNSIGDAVIATNTSGEVTRMNAIATKLTGWQFAEAKGRPLTEILTTVRAETRNPLVNPTQTVFADGKTAGLEKSFILLAKNGTEFRVASSGAPIQDDTGAITGVVLVLRDVTDDYAVRRALEDSEARFRDFAESSSDWFWETNAQGRVIWESESGSETKAGLPFDDVRGLTREEIAGDLMTDVEWQPYRKALEARTDIHDFVYAYRGRDGQRRYAAIDGKPRFNPSGAYLGHRGAASDITDRKKFEVQMRRAQKMEAVGKLTGGIAHDFNNILGIILGNIALLRPQVENFPETRKRLGTIERSAQRAVVLTKQLLGFSRRQAAQVTVTDLNHAVKEMESLITRSLTPEVEVSFRLTENLWLTKIDPGDFHDTLLNLVLNARDAMKGAGRLAIETANQTLDIGYCTRNPGTKPGDYVQLAVRDDGEGIPHGSQEHIFEPFFTTKPPGKGTGLGLAMVYGFVERSNGHIRVHSEVGAGATFRLYLPKTREQLRSTAAAAKISQHAPRGEETLLVVDDEPGLLDLAHTSLQSLGYKVITAGGGRQALTRLRETPAVALLFSDVVMPGGMSGYELAERAIAERPDLRILLTSGYVDKTLTDNSRAGFAPPVLNKPYSQLELAQRVRTLLDASGPDQSAE